MLYDAIEYLLDEATRQNVYYSLKYTGSYDTMLQYHQGLIHSICEKNFEEFVKCILATRDRSADYERRSKAETP
jgi:hypothetical protein